LAEPFVLDPRNVLGAFRDWDGTLIDERRDVNMDERDICGWKRDILDDFAEDMNSPPSESFSPASSGFQDIVIDWIGHQHRVWPARYAFSVRIYATPLRVGLV
jgi:hypothetical protein